MKKWQGGTGGGVTEKKKESKNCEVRRVGWPFIGPINLQSELKTKLTRGKPQDAQKLDPEGTNPCQKRNRRTDQREGVFKIEK